MARDNPWYVLATLNLGHSDKDDKNLAAKNRAYWNAWASQGMDEEQKRQVKDPAGRSILKDTPEWDTIKTEINRLFRRRVPNGTLPDPTQPIKFCGVNFTNDVSFSSYYFRGAADFTNAIFTGGANFRSAAFVERADFDDARFSGLADFFGANFSKQAFFQRTTFSDQVHFDFAVFSGEAGFIKATFSGFSDFQDVTFSASTNFNNAAFSNKANFFQTEFLKQVDFYSTLFSAGANFDKATFSGDAYFQSATFSKKSSFTESTFVQRAKLTDAVFEAPCNLRSAVFKTSYPNLEGTLLHSKTIVTANERHWPAKITEQSNEEAQESCAHLRQNMAAQGLSDATHFFFREEMKYKAKTAKLWERPFYALYGIAQYGYGVWQPLLGIFFLWVIGFCLLFHLGCLSVWTAAGLSFANIFKFFGFQRVYFDSNILNNLSHPLEIITAGQTVLGYLLLFLLGLGLRNRFRLK